MPHIMIVDSDEVVAELLARALRDVRGDFVTTITDLTSLENHLKQVRPDLVCVASVDAAVGREATARLPQYTAAPLILYGLRQSPDWPHEADRVGLVWTPFQVDEFLNERDRLLRKD